MMMPERNQKLDERHDQLATEDDYQRPEQTIPEQQRGADEMRADEMRTDEMRTDEMRTGEMPPEETTPPEQTRSEEQVSGQQVSGQQVSGQQVSGQQVSGQQVSGQQGAHAQDGQRARLVPEDHAASYASRWDAIKGTFVDEPREAAAQADALVGELLEELETLFREQRREIEQGLDADETSTEDLRMALRRYRSFFDRLLAL
jgi:hypothetical protein